MKNKIKILCGKSSSGKNYINDYLVSKCDYTPIISMTTRPMRKNEKNNIDYEFVSEKTFNKFVELDRFVEYRSYNTLWNGEKCVWYYGVLKQNLDLEKQKLVIILDFKGAKDFISYYGKDNCELIYIDCDEKIREDRARKRGSFDEMEWFRRLADDEVVFDMNEMKDWIDKIIVNENKSIEEVIGEIINENKNVDN